MRRPYTIKGNFEYKDLSPEEKVNLVGSLQRQRKECLIQSKQKRRKVTKQSEKENDE